MRTAIEQSYRMEVHSDVGRAIVLNRLESYANGFAITIEPLPKNTRTLAQNRTYWQWLGLISDHTGYDTRWLDNHYRTQYLEPRVEVRFGNLEHIYPSTRELSVEVMSTLMQHVSMDAGTLGVVLPLYDYEELAERVA